MDITKIKTKRMNLRTKIRDYIKAGKNADHLYTEYNNLLEEMRKMGINVSTKNSTIYLNTVQQTIKTESNFQPIIEEPKQFKFILTLAWDNTMNNAYIISYIKEYLRLMSIELYDEGFTELPNKTEYTIKYVFYGTKEEFKILKKSTNIILDMFPEQNKNNIVIFGKEMIY